MIGNYNEDSDPNPVNLYGSQKLEVENYIKRNIQNHCILRIAKTYSSKIGNDKSEFNEYLQTINRQIKDIEKLVNEFSNFARMPRPVVKKIDLNEVIIRSIDFLKISLKSKISFNKNNKSNFIMGDEDQLYRVFINIIKNAFLIMLMDTL